MAEEKVKTLAELYDRTKKCTGIKIPKNTLIFVYIGPESFAKLEMKLQFPNNFHMIASAIREVTDALMTAGVEEICVVYKELGGVEGRTFDNSLTKKKSLLELIEDQMESFKNSRRPMCHLKFKRLSDDTYSGEFETAIVLMSGAGIIRSSDNKNCFKNFKSKKTVLLKIGENERCTGVNFSRNIYTLANNGDILSNLFPDGTVPSFSPLLTALPTHQDIIEKRQFDMNYRVVMEAIYLLCSEELSNVFTNSIRAFDTLKSDGILFKDILTKFKAQGLIDSNQDIDSIDYERAVVSLENFPFRVFNICYKDILAGIIKRDNEPTQVFDRVTSVEDEMEGNPLEMFYTLHNMNPSWKKKEWQKLLEQEARLEQPESSVNVTEDASTAEPEEASEAIPENPQEIIAVEV